MTPTTPKEELTIADAAERFGINRRSLQRTVERGKIPSRKPDGINVYLIDAEAARLYGEVAKARAALATYTGIADSE